MRLSKLEIELRKHGLPFPFTELVVNGRVLFHLSTQKAIEDRVRLRFSGGFVKEPVYCLEGITPRVTVNGFSPREISVNKRTFVHRLGNFFSAKKLTKQEMVSFFDIVAPYYNSLIEREPNSEIIRRLFEKIKVKYGLKQSKKRGFRLKNQLELLTRETPRGIPKLDQPSASLTLPWDKANAIRILDWGTGTGLSYHIYRKKRGLLRRHSILLGCDISEGMLKQCRAKAKDYEVFKCEYASSPFPDCFFDVVFAVFVTPYFVDERPYREIFRILKPGGLFAFNLSTLDYNKNSGYLDQTLRTIGFRGINFEIWRVSKSGNTRHIPMVFAERD